MKGFVTTPPDLGDILDVVCRYFPAKPSDVLHTRQNKVSRKGVLPLVRQVLSVFAVRKYSYKQPLVGDFLHLDASSVNKAIKKLYALADTDKLLLTKLQNMDIDLNLSLGRGTKVFPLHHKTAPTPSNRLEQVKVSERKGAVFHRKTELKRQQLCTYTGELLPSTNAISNS